MTDYPHSIVSPRQKRQVQSQAAVISLNSPTYIADTGINSSHYVFKRIVDLGLSILALLILTPFLLLIALLIVLDSGGSAIYSQPRIGSRRVKRGGKIVWEQFQFKMYKFRTMRAGNSSRLHRQFAIAFIHNDEEGMNAIKRELGEEEILADGTKECQYKLNADPRVTRIGKFLRKTSLDELPQILNVLRGEMSLVGPRPPIPYEAREYQHWHRKRFAAYQGLTGYWQITGRSEVSFDEMVELDIWYTEHQSLLLDFKIMILTPLQVLRGKGAK